LTRGAGLAAAGVAQLHHHCLDNFAAGGFARSALFLHPADRMTAARRQHVEKLPI
jgi:hypothetical protein